MLELRQPRRSEFQRGEKTRQMDTLCLKLAIHEIAPANALRVRAEGRSTADKSAVALPSPQKSAPSRFSFRVQPSEFLRLGGGKEIKGKKTDLPAVEEAENGNAVETEGQNGNWVLKILHVGSVWRRRDDESEDHNGVVGSHDCLKDDDDDDCDVCRIAEDDKNEELEFDRESFSRMLRKVSLAEAKLFAKMSYLGNLAYTIPKIKPGYLLKYHGLRFVTSSIEKRELARKAEISRDSSEDEEAETIQMEELEDKEQKNPILRISPSAAYRIAASAASYLHSQSKTILPFGSSKTHDVLEGESKEDANADILKSSDVASLMATTDSVTAVVAAKEEVKQAVADDLKSMHSSPCQWYVCDDDKTSTRFFVIQGSESLASWQANLLFEPVSFEGQDVLVHRGIYEAAKGIYEQVLPEVHAHLESRAKSCAFFRFTGHSLGGSLSLLVNLMLLIRGQVSAPSLLPVITFGSPCIMCGGDRLLQKLGLPRSHLQAIMMHRDIVPRAFSCNYPNRVVEILRAVNRNFQNHPCLNIQKFLYASMGELLILQPEEKFSAQHHLLPSGSGLYILTRTLSNTKEAERQLRAARTVFLNSPHPLEILRDRSSYGSKGTIKRDHDVHSYLKSLKVVIRNELKQIRKAKREMRRILWWPLMAPHVINLGIIGSSNNDRQQLFVFLDILRTGKDSLKRFGRFIASRNMHLVVLLLLPIKLLLVGAYGLVHSR